MIISFSGIDGSGKSTLAKRTKEFFDSKGTPVKFIEVYKSSIYLTAGRILGSFSARIKKNIEKAHEEKRGVKKITLHLLRKICLLLDIIIFDVRSVCFRRINKAIVCDRYFFDILVHYIFLGVIKESEVEFFLKIIPKSTFPIVLTTNEKIAQEREGEHNDVCYYQKKNELYKKLGRDLGLIMIDSSSEVNRTWAQIESIITKVGNKNILMVSRAVEPPWDEASKNLVRDIVTFLNNYSFYIFTKRRGVVWHKDITRYDIYSDNTLRLRQKFRLLLFLLVHRSDFDIYHFCFTPEYFTSCIIKKIISKRKCVQSIPYITQKLKTVQVKKLIYSDAVVVNSRYSRDILLRNNIKNVHLIYPSVDTALFSNAIDKDVAKYKTKLRAAHNVLWAGKFATDFEIKALEAIIRSVFALDKKIHFIIAARLDDRAHLKRQLTLQGALQNKSFEGRITFLNTVDDMALLMAACDVMMYPFFGGFKKKIDIPYVIIEAIASAMPIVISDKAPFDEVIQAGAALAIAKDDPEEFAKAIVMLCSNETFRKKLGDQNRQVALRHFDTRKNISNFDAIYKTLLGNGNNQ
ncbi:MAG: glycosyltransferase [Candidatus Omnitrophica bacterium]|jgi:glycosyltransferase involved in cell wall biosynthesis|nr:glycosyltransferase [Candidatus Omnitrophota bacterium]